MAGTGSPFFSGGLFWRWLRFGRNWLHILFWQIVLEAAQIWRELAPHYFPADCFGGGSDFAGTGSTLFYIGLFWRQLRFCGNLLHIIYWRIVMEAAQIWWELAPHYFPMDCFGGSSDLAGTGSTLFSVGLFWRQLRFGGNWLHTIFRMLMPEFFYQGIFPRVSWRTAYLLGCNKSKVRCRHSNQWPDNCTFFPVVICNLIKEPAKNHSNKPVKTIQAHGTNPPNIATDGQTKIPSFLVII